MQTQRRRSAGPGPAVARWCLVGLVVALTGAVFGVSLPAGALDVAIGALRQSGPSPSATSCPAQPTPYNVDLSVTPAQVEVGEEVAFDVEVTDATGAAVECGDVVLKIAGGGTVPARPSARLQSEDLSELMWFGLSDTSGPPQVRVHDPGNYDIVACLDAIDIDEFCGVKKPVTASCDEYGTPGDDSLTFYLDVLFNRQASICALGGNDTITIQDDLDGLPSDFPPLFISGGDGNDLMLTQYVTGDGVDTKPHAYIFNGGAGDDETGRGIISLPRESDFRAPILIGDWSYPGIRPPTETPGHDTLRLPLLGGTAEGGPGNDTILGGPDGPNNIAGQYPFASAAGWAVHPVDRTFIQYSYFDMLDNDTITGGDHADNVEGGFDLDLIELLGGRDDAVGDIWIRSGSRLPVFVGGSGIRFGDDEIDAGNNPADATPENILGEISACCVIARAGARFQGDVPAVDGGDDTLVGGSGRQRLDGQSGADELTGGAGNDKLIGGAGDDVLKGSAGSDVLTAGAGRDVLDGGKGDDRCAGGPGADRDSRC